MNTISRSASGKWIRQWQPTPVLLPGKSHGRRSLVGCSPWGHEESDTTKWLHFHFSLSCIGEGNGNPLQCSCLENPRDREAWWAAIYGVTQSQTRLKRLSSSSRQQSQRHSAITPVEQTFFTLLDQFNHCWCFCPSRGTEFHYGFLWGFWDHTV